MPNYMIAHLDEVAGVECPCGISRRAFACPDNHTATLHMVDISEDARVHYHKNLTEIYLVLEVEGRGCLELDGELVPAFDPGDEWFD